VSKNSNIVAIISEFLMDCQRYLVVLLLVADLSLDKKMLQGVLSKKC
jgi:hypothetical protein